MPDERLPDDQAAVMRARRHAYVIRKRVMAEVRRLRRLVELGGVTVTASRKGARWQFGRTKLV